MVTVRATHRVSSAYANLISNAQRLPYSTHTIIGAIITYKKIACHFVIRSVPFVTDYTSQFKLWSFYQGPIISPLNSHMEILVTENPALPASSLEV